MWDRWKDLWLYCIPCVWVLPVAVVTTALGLESEIDARRLTFGLPLLAVGIIALEGLHRLRDLVAAEAQRATRARDAEARKADSLRRFARDLPAMQAAVVVLVQLLSVAQFVFILDGHIRLRACVWVYLAYLIGAAGVLVGRQARTGWGWRYLWWGWAPGIAFGVPVALPGLRAAGLVPYGPLSW
jgi:hypothetical protein